MTFGRGAGFRVHMNGVIGAGLHTAFAADADGVVELDDAILALVHRTRWTDGRAGWVGAVVAARDLEMPSTVWKVAGLDGFNPRSMHAQRNLVFAFTGGRASMAANAGPVVDNEAKVHADLVARRRYTKRFGLRCRVVIPRI